VDGVPLSELMVGKAATLDLRLSLLGGAPKKKGKADKPKDKAEEGGAPEPDARTSPEEMKEGLALLRGELEHEREERNYFQLERDKVNTFWEISKKELEDRKAELRNKDREMEELEERHQVEIKVYKQKVRRHSHPPFMKRELVFISRRCCAAIPI
jgi:hypothetical protein